jgi:beta-galactosidase
LAHRNEKTRVPEKTGTLVAGILAESASSRTGFARLALLPNDAIQLRVEGPAEILGDHPFALVGRTGALWQRAKEQAGRVRLRAWCPILGKRQVDFEPVVAPPEAV